MFKVSFKIIADFLDPPNPPSGKVVDEKTFELFAIIHCQFCYTNRKRRSRSISATSYKNEAMS